jgi:hypothetical protein
MPRGPGAIESLPRSYFFEETSGARRAPQPAPEPLASTRRSSARHRRARGSSLFYPAPLSGGDRKALKKELSKSRAMTSIFAERSAEKRRAGEALIREADSLACQLWNERMWSDGGPIDPSPTIDQAINSGYPWLEIECSRCKTRAMSISAHCAGRQQRSCTISPDALVCRKRKSAGKRPAATLLQLGPRQRHRAPEG